MHKLALASKALDAGLSDFLDAQTVGSAGQFLLLGLLRNEFPNDSMTDSRQLAPSSPNGHRSASARADPVFEDEWSLSDGARQLRYSIQRVHQSGCIMARFYLRDATEVQGFLELAGKNGVTLNREAIEYACHVLNDEWLTLVDAGWPNCICTLSMSRAKASTGLALSQWIDIVGSLHLLRNTDGIAEQVRRLRISSHERLDTALVIVVAGRYKARGFEVAFEPNGRGCSDLSVRTEDQRFYVEVKRENPQDQDRFKTFTANASSLLDSLQASLGEWLSRSHSRVEVKFSRGFSQSVVEKIRAELAERATNAPLRTEQALSIPPNSKFVVLRDDAPYFEQGFSVGRMTVKDVPVQVHPKNMPVRVIFEWPPNFAAAARLVREARRQLGNDLKVDTSAVGFVVVQARGGPELVEVMERRLLRTLPNYCLGVVFLSDLPGGIGQIIFRDGLAEEMVGVMAHSAG